MLNIIIQLSVTALVKMAQALVSRHTQDSPQSPPPSPSSQVSTEEENIDEVMQTSDNEKEAPVEQSPIGLPLKRGVDPREGADPRSSNLSETLVNNDSCLDTPKKQFKLETYYDQVTALKTKFVNTDNGENLLLLAFPSMVCIGYQVKDNRGGLPRSAICIKMNETPHALEALKKINQLFLGLIKHKDETIHVEEEIDITEKKAGFKVVAKVNHNFEIMLYRAWCPLEAPGKYCNKV